MAVLIGWLADIDDPSVYAALVIVVGAVPAAITWAVELMRRRGKSER